MQRDARAYLWDAPQAAELLSDFSKGEDFAGYQANPMLRSAVERQFEIIGEALNQLSKVDSVLAAQVPDLGRIVAFRNILIHGYATVDDALVWQVLTERLPGLASVLRRLLER
ncbi:HepT-like ribonuclease domain-containing protein [Saccharopolyspora shandongensis]|uniref:HepT-like ribonuclease domain-containing protein n=1 Tax=Saccharopolyspora shandongensis TaxID=418495 RepID=UPI0033D1C45F